MSALCPYRTQHACSTYIEAAGEISDSLAERIEDHYCNGDYHSCSRYQAARNGTLVSEPDLAPWSDIRHAPGGTYVSQPRTERHADHADSPGRSRPE
ncbi:MAG: hypothetical protein ACOCZU_04355 [Planctomycetota bacterium]